MALPYCLYECCSCQSNVPLNQYKSTFIVHLQAGLGIYEEIRMCMKESIKLGYGISVAVAGARIGVS
jgi:hypothetical protein